MACKDFDYTVVIAIMHCPHHTITFGAKTHLGDGSEIQLKAFAVPPSAAIA